jgi:hypothetical protein
MPSALLSELSQTRGAGVLQGGLQPKNIHFQSPSSTGAGFGVESKTGAQICSIPSHFPAKDCTWFYDNH